MKYDNITISGGAGTGKTTLYRNLQPYLQSQGWKFKTIGELFREHVKDNVMPTATKVSEQYDRDIENMVEKLLTTEKNWVIEAWLAGFVARNLPRTFRILVVCRDMSLRVDRIANRDKISIDQAKKFIKEREETNFAKYRKLYGDYNFWNPEYFHLIIDTYELGQHEAVDKVLIGLGYKVNP